MIWDAKLKKQVKTVELLFNVRVGFYDVNTKVKRILPGHFEINTNIKEKLIGEMKSTYGLMISFNKVPLEHSSLELSLLHFPLSLEED